MCTSRGTVTRLRVISAGRSRAAGLIWGAPQRTPRCSLGSSGLEFISSRLIGRSHGALRSRAGPSSRDPVRMMMMPSDGVDAVVTPGGTARVLRTLGVRPRKRWGQHFLVDAHALTQILSAADLDRKSTRLNSSH